MGRFQRDELAAKILTMTEKQIRALGYAGYPEIEVLLHEGSARAKKEVQE